MKMGAGWTWLRMTSADVSTKHWAIFCENIRRRYTFWSSSLLLTSFPTLKYCYDFAHKNSQLMSISDSGTDHDTHLKIGPINFVDFNLISLIVGRKQERSCLHYLQIYTRTQLCKCNV